MAKKHKSEKNKASDDGHAESLSHNESLIESLDKAAASVVSDAVPRTPLQPPSWVETDEGEIFLQGVQAEGSLQLFDGRMQLIGNMASAVDRNQLANWMVERARIVGARQAVKEVERYIKCDSFEAYQVMLLSGLSVESEFDLGDDIRLVPFHNVPNQHLQALLGRHYWNALPTPKLSSALIRPFLQQKDHPAQANTSERKTLSYLPHEIQRALQDALLCLALTRGGGIGVQAIGSTTVARDDVPILSGFAWSIHPYRSPGFEAPLIALEAQTAKSLHKAFLALDPISKGHLRIPIQKLNECAASWNSVQGAIDLRTALEALFLSDDVQGELSYRLSLRAAAFNGGDIDSRIEIQQKAKKAYRFCSKAVHSGRLDLKENEAETLKWARKLVWNTLRRMILDGNTNPDWKVLELTGGTDCDE